MFPTWLRSAPAWQGKLVQKPEKFERQQGDVYEVTTKVLFLPGEMNFKLLRALSIKWHMDTFAKLPVQGIATCCGWVNSPAANPPYCA